MKKLFLIVFATTFTIAGEGNSILIDPPDSCCECNCEYNPMEDVTYYGEDINLRYKYFGGVPHICIGNHCRDEKGIDLTKPHKPHICRGERCDARCCFSIEDYFYLKYKDDDINLGNEKFPVIPTPPPVSADH